MISTSIDDITAEINNNIYQSNQFYLDIQAGKLNQPG